MIQKLALINDLRYLKIGSLQPETISVRVLSKRLSAFCYCRTLCAKLFLSYVELSWGNTYDFFLALATQRVKFHRIAGASEVVTRARELVVRQY